MNNKSRPILNYCQIILEKGLTSHLKEPDSNMAHKHALIVIAIHFVNMHAGCTPICTHITTSALTHTDTVDTHIHTHAHTACMHTHTHTRNTLRAEVHPKDKISDHTKEFSLTAVGRKEPWNLLVLVLKHCSHWEESCLETCEVST